MYNKKLKFTFNSLIFVFGILFGQLGYASNSEIENCSGYKTYSQGGWGNPTSAQGVYLSNNFSTVFPNGITVGSNTKYLKFTSALAVTNFLPSGGTSGRIGDVTLTNPLTSNAGNLGGQLLAVMINAEVDAKISSFARSSGNLYDLKIAKGYFTNFTVRELIKEANEYISGKVVTYSVTDLLSALDGIIKSYDNGEQASADDLYIVCQLKNTSINTNVLCNGDSTGTIEITSTSGGKGDNYTYNWSNGKTGAKQTKLTAGTYYVTTSALVSTGKYITRRDTFTITEPTKLNASSSLTTKVLCKGGDATVTISANGGTAPYTGTGTFTVKAGTHEYTVTDANGCTSITSIIVVEPTALNASSSASTILCNGGDATITVTGNGGTAPYTGTGTFTVKAGTYEYTVTDSNGCSATTSITVVEPSELKANSSLTTKVLCKGGDATITITGNGGTAPYTGTGTFTVKAGTHEYTVTDSNGCSATTSITLVEPTELSASSSATKILCNGGEATVTVTGNGGTKPYSGTGTFTVKAGTYEYTVTDSNGCTATTSITVVEPSELKANSSLTTKVLCKGGDATITISGNGGTAPYTGTGTFTVKAGTHEYTVTDSNGCTATTSITVVEPTELSASSSATKILCNGGDATITVTGNGGTAPYTGTGTFTVKSGTYEYTVTDSNGCSATTSITVVEPTELSANSTLTTKVLCKGGDATITISGNGGTSPYTGTGTFTVKAGTHEYTVTDSNGCTATTSITVVEPTELTAGSSATKILCNGGETTVTITGNGGTAPYTGTGTFTVKAGTHEYTVTDSNGCTATTSITVVEPTELSASSSATKILCNGGEATITVTGNGGTAPYTGTGTFTVKAGTHEFTVTDSNGCTATTSITVVEPTELSASSSATKILCNGGEATVTVTGNGGTAPYTGTGTFIVKAGTHEYTVTDSNGCSATTSITVVEPSELKANSSLTTKVLCNGGDATITISGNGGTAPYTGTGTYTVKAGTHEYTVTDSNGCTAITSITVDEPSLLSIGSSATDILCNGGNSTVTIIADGGTAPYTGTGTFTVKAGTHEYKVTDANGCSKSTSITVTEPNKLSLTGTIVKDESCNGGLPNGSATLTVTGGTSPYTYVWTNANSTSNIATGLAYNTTPSVVVTDANGCSSTYTFETITCIIVCPPLKTFTQGGWGSTPNGNNPGTYLNANFASAFPLGLTIGKGTSKAVFTSATAIRNFLPSSGNSALLPKTILTNPTKTNLKNTLAGQLVAAMLNVGFDTYSPAFAAPDKKLGDMLINTGTFKGMSVTALLNEANNAISGGSTRYTLTQFTEALTKINENYDNGTIDKAFLICPPVQTLTRGLNNENTTTSNTLSTSENNTIKLYPNPASSNFFLSFESNIETTGTIKLINLAGQLISVETISISQGVNNFEVDLASKSINANMIIVELKYNDVIKHSMLMVK